MGRKIGKLGSSRRLPPEFARGGEHQVFFVEKTQRYLKATLPDRQRGYGIALGSFSHGATPSEYLDRLDLQNQIFDDDIRLERVVIKSGKPIIITSQPAIKGGSPTPAALDELMTAKGYEKLADGAYFDERAGLLVFDLFPRHAIQTGNGGCLSVDPVIQRITLNLDGSYASIPTILISVCVDGVSLKLTTNLGVPFPRCHACTA